MFKFNADYENVTWYGMGPAETYADRPIITMSMSGTGVISRLTGEFFGSALTFGAAAKASAPGQIPVSELETVLSVIHKSC